jgi:hypothetical protein
MAAVLAAVTGACFYNIAAKRRLRNDELWMRRRDAYAQWLGTQMALPRVCLSFVSAFRTLANEPRESRYFTLRLEEAQRARQSWCDAMSEMDRAEAKLVVWADDVDVRKKFDELGCVTPVMLRQAINGDECGVRELRDVLEHRVERARRWVQDAVRDTRGERAPIGETISRCTSYVRTIMDRWSRP